MPGVVPAPGTLVWIRRQRWRVERALGDHHVVRIDVAHRDRRLTFFTPFDRLERISAPTRPRCARRQEALALGAGVIARATSFRAPRSLIDARIDLLPHQIEPVLAVLAGARRVLLADEVGLGKTVQAGIVIAELVIRQPSVRVLAIVPASLTAQWQDELDRRFGLRSQIAGRRALDDIVRTERRGTDPWMRAGIWLASSDYLKQPHVLEAVPRVPWDLVIVDEAHEACGDSDRHEACAEMARRARHVLLLTATPHSGDAVRFARLERMGSLDALDDSLITFRRSRRDLGHPDTRRVRWHRVELCDAERRVLDALAAFESATLNAAGTSRIDAALLLLSVFRKRALSTMTALDLSLGRRLSVIQNSTRGDVVSWSQSEFDFGDASDEFSDGEHSALVGHTGLRAIEERSWLSRLRLLVRPALQRESKIARIVRLVARTTEPIVIFTEFRHSLVSIARHLARCRVVTVLHGGQTAAERASSLATFLDGRASVLVATDVAGQGLNLQARARWIASVELPWNPARLEQRIGRVDRIGQKRTVHATLLVARHNAESGLLSRLAVRTITARRSLGEDTLPDSAPPADLDIAKCLLTSSADYAPREVFPSITSCSSWRRAARAVVRQMMVRRALARRWRHPIESGRRPLWTKCRLRAGLDTPRPGQIAIISVRVTNVSGALVERLLFAIHIPPATRPVVNAVARSACTNDTVAKRLHARLRRLTRLVTAQANRRALIEEALAGYLVAIGTPAQLQPGLFGRREVRALDKATIGRGLLAPGVNVAIVEGNVSLDAAPPVVELILCADR